MIAKSCPANNPNCNAQLYTGMAIDFVFCPVCKLPNPNYHRTSAIESRARENTGNIAGKQPVVDIKAGVIHWK